MHCSCLCCKGEVDTCRRPESTDLGQVAGTVLLRWMIFGAARAKIIETRTEHCYAMCSIQPNPSYCFQVLQECQPLATFAIDEKTSLSMRPTSMTWMRCLSIARSCHYAIRLTVILRCYHQIPACYEDISARAKLYLVLVALCCGYGGSWEFI